VGEVAWIAPQPDACAFVRYRDGTVRVGAWRDLAGSRAEMAWWRQTPPCMVLAGKRHPGLWDRESRGWGAALGGDTVIRRSAVGLAADGQVLFVGITNHTTAQALADGMLHVGAADVAELDVNWSFPKFVMFRELEDGRLHAHSLFEGFEAADDDFVRRSSPRDFFYVARRAP
jgi:hypothetical protein